MNDHTVDKTRCAAYGCPCAATTSNGGSQWFCPYHLGTDAISWARITLELKRLDWLSTICRGIRLCHGTEKWEKAYRQIQRDITLNQRSDLLFDKDVDGSVNRWLTRLEAIIDRAARGAEQPQLSTQVSGEQQGMQRLQFPTPQPA